MKEIVTLDNGNVIMDTIVDCHRRPPQKKKSKDDNHKAPLEQQNSEESPQGTEEEESGESGKQQSDIVSDRWRLISADTLWPSMGGIPVCVDYSYDDAKAIRQACEIMNKKRTPVMWNHTNDLQAMAGYVDRCNIENSKDIPLGVNGYINIPKHYDQKAALGIETGLIGAGSISISCEMKKSHPDIPLDEFLDLMGEEVKGEVVRFLPVNARDVIHYGLVSRGADSFAGPRKTNHSRTEPNKIITGGSKNMENMEKAIKLLASVCENMGLEVILDENNVPDSLEARLTEKLEGMVDAKQKYNTLCEQVQGLKDHVKADENETLKSSEILNRLPEVLAYAEHGHKYVENLKAEALKAFDAAKVNPETAELSDSAKALRKIIESTNDIDALKAYLEEYSVQKDERIGAADHRSSKGEELPEDKKEKKFDRRSADISDNVTRLFK